MTADELPAVLDVPELSELMRISTWQTYELIKKGEIRALKLGRCLRIPRAEVLRLLGES